MDEAAGASPIVVSDVLSIANYNMHCGMDGWGRPYDYLGAISSLSADVIVIEESWTTEGNAESQAEEAARALGYQVVTHTTGEGRRIRPQPGAPDTWLARPAFAERNRALYLDGVKPVSDSVQTLARWQEAEPGSIGTAVLVRPSLPIEATRLAPMSALPADRVRRAALVVDLTVEGHPLSVVGVHMSHLAHGSHRNWAELRRQLDTVARPDAVLAGDMNTWGPLVHVFIPGWRRAVIGRTWPTWRPHSQIDHILVRGPVLQVRRGEVLAHAGSDHRPVRAELELGAG
ncbi:MAG TPA: endonuclease/exonuclease/phosphatase family protein [Acidimicrobiales bacterium]|nr:endonuclease/exonuclease/phosphatase family protein [Acidimicrobiales bacterium]